MLDISLYRHRIGTFTQKLKIRNSRSKDLITQKSNIQDKCNLQLLFRTIIILSILQQITYSSTGSILQQKFSPERSILQHNRTGIVILPHWGNLAIQLEFRTCSRNLSANFLARYKFGNPHARSKGIKNLHLNIRSLGNKIAEIKYIVKQHIWRRLRKPAKPK